MNRPNTGSPFVLTVGSTPSTNGRWCANTLVERPLDAPAANIERAKQLEEQLLRGIDVAEGAARALVVNQGLGGLAVGLDGNGLAAHGVAVGLGAHQRGRDGDNVGAVVLAAVVNAA